MDKCPSNRFTSPRACSLLGPHPTSVSPSFQVDFVSSKRLANRGRKVSVGVPTQNASTLDLVSPLSHECWWKVGRFRAAHSGLDGSVRAIVDRRPLAELARLRPSIRSSPASYWPRCGPPLQPHVQGGQHGRAFAILEHWKACSNKRLRRPG
jgi:hypothetical protein